MALPFQSNALANTSTFLFKAACERDKNIPEKMEN